MNYEKNHWSAGQPITSTKMNHIEDGIEYAVSEANVFVQVQQAMSNAAADMSTATAALNTMQQDITKVTAKTDGIYNDVFELKTKLDSPRTYSTLLALGQYYKGLIDALTTASGNYSERIDVLEATTSAHTTTLGSLDERIIVLTNANSAQNTTLSLIGQELGLTYDSETNLWSSDNSRIDEIEARIDLLDGQENGVIKGIQDEIDAITSVLENETTGLAATKVIADAAKSSADAANAQIGTGFSAQNTVASAISGINTTLSNKANSADVTTALSGKVDTSDFTTLTNTVNSISTTIIVPKNKVTFENDVPVSFANTIEIAEKNDYLIQHSDNKYYYWKPIKVSDSPVTYEWNLISGAGGSGSGNSNSEDYATYSDFEEAAPELNKDYYVLENDGIRHHYRYIENDDINNPFTLIEIGQVLNVNNVKTYSLQSSTENETNYIDLYQFDYGIANSELSDGTRIAHIELVGGGSGGTVSARKFTRITPRSVNTAKGSDQAIELRYFYTTGVANESDVFTLTQSNKNMVETVIMSGSIDSGDPSAAATVWPQTTVTGFGMIDVTSFCKDVGVQTFTLTARDPDNEENYTTIKWEVNVINLTVTSNYTQNIISALNQDIRFTYIPSGDIEKVAHFVLIDSNNTETILDTVTLSARTINEQTYTISMPQAGEGIYKLKVYLTATIGTKTITSESLYRDLIWRAENSTNLYIGSPYRGQTINAQQYETVIIPYTVSGNTNNYTVQYYIDDSTTPFNEVVLNNTAGGEWHYKPTSYGTQVLKIMVEEEYITITLNISEMTTDIAPVMSDLVLDFNPQGLSNNSDFAKSWTNGTNNLSVSPNFDWYNGGYGSDETGDYFLVKSGTRAYFDYKMFESAPETINTEGNNITTTTSKVYTTGQEMKIIFKTSAVRSIDAIWFTNTGRYDSNINKEVGIQLSAHQGWLKTDSASDTAITSGDEQIAATNTYLYFPYSEEDKIELDISINKETNQEGNFIMSYEDGVPSKAYAYTHNQKLYHEAGNESIITIGSDDCDVYIYRLRIYNNELTSAQVLRNFIADGKDIDECLARYNRNCIYYDSDHNEYSPYGDANFILDPEALAKKIPNVKVLMLDAPSFTLNKKSFIKDSTLRCIHAPGGTKYASRGAADNWFFENGYHAGQGTTSDKYGDAGRNIDFLFNCDGTHKPSDKVSPIANYISQVTVGYGTENAQTTAVTDWKGSNGKISLTGTSIPNNFFNFKVNIASSENVNNALLQKRYNDFLPYVSPAKARDSRIKNDMEFVPAVLFLRENGDGEHSEFNDTNWHFYALGNLGDSKKTDYTRAYDPDDINEFTLEISDNNTNNSQFQTGVYMLNGQETLETFAIDQDYEDDGVTPITGSFTARGTSGAIASTDYVYPITTEQWNEWDSTNNRYKNKAHWALTNERYDGDHSFEMRYACKGDYRDGKLVNDTTGKADAQLIKNSKVWQAFYSWVVTSTNEEFIRDLDQWCVRSAVEFWYAFTHYYTMMDNRAKNTFWHFGKTGVHREVLNPIDDMIHTYDELDDENYVRTEDTTVQSGKTYYTEYAFDLWDYDNDTALGIDNNGELIFPYGKEDGDYKISNDPSSGYVFNGAGSVFWRRLRDLCTSEISSIFTSVSEQFFSATNLIEKFDEFQECYPEALWQVDINRKYVRPFTGKSMDGSIPKDNKRFLKSMMQGRKKYQRRQWIKDQYYYFGSKYKLGNVMGDLFLLDCYTGPDDALIAELKAQGRDEEAAQYVESNWNITITPYQDMYLNASFGETPKAPVRAKAGQPVEMEGIFTDMNNSRIYIYGASRLQALEGKAIRDPQTNEIIGAEGLASLYFGNNEFIKTDKLRKLNIGTDKSTYRNANLQSLTLNSNSPILEELNMKNCGSLAGEQDLSGCNNLRTLEAEGTNYTRIILPSSSQITTLHLPSTITNLTLLSARQLTDFYMKNKATGEIDYNSLREMLIDNSNYSSNINWLTITSEILNNLSYLYLLNLSTATITDINALEQFKTRRYELTDPSRLQLTGTIHVTGDWSEIEKATYEQEWNNELELDVIQENKSTKYAVTYRYNAYDDGLGNIIDSQDILTLYINSGDQAPDIFANGTIEKPTRAQTVSTIYTFGSYDTITEGSPYIPYSGWQLEGTNTPLSTGPIISSNTVIETYFVTNARKYPIKWYLYENDPTSLIKTSIAVNYGKGEDQEAPTVADIHVAGKETCSVSIQGGQVNYSIFSGWDKLPININPSVNDTSFNIYATWSTGSTTITEMFDNANISNLTPEQLLVLSAMDSTTKSTYGITSKIGENTRITYNLGHDSDGGQLLANILRLDTPTATPITTNIQPLKAGNDAFTIAIDYCFNTDYTYSHNYGILASCYYGNETANVRNGFALYYDKTTGPRVGFGDMFNFAGQSISVGNINNAGQRNIIILRHPAGSSDLYIYSGLNSNINTPVSISTNTIRQLNYNSNAYLTFGQLIGRQQDRDELDGTPDAVDNGKGTIYWSKYWNKDLGEGECKRLAAWPHEPMTYAISYLSNERTSVSRIGNNSTYSIKLASMTLSSHDKFFQARNTTESTYSWQNSLLYNICNQRIFNGLPTKLQAILCKARTSSTTTLRSDGGTNVGITYSMRQSNTLTIDYVQMYSAANVLNDGSIYESEDSVNSPFSWFDPTNVISYELVNNSWAENQTDTGKARYLNIRFPYKAIAWNNKLRVFRETTSTVSANTSIAELIATSTGSINIGDVYINASGRVYIYVSDTEVQTYGIQFKSAIDDSRFASSYEVPGKWVEAEAYWTRSMIVHSSGVNLAYVNSNGEVNITTVNSATTTGLKINYLLAI